MRNSTQLVQFFRDNVALLMVLVIVVILAGAWIVFEAARSLKNREEVFKLRRKLAAMERERTGGGGPKFRDPVVLSSRWIRSGGAATTSDGGCLLYIERISADKKSAEITIRVDGFAVIQNHGVSVGERLEANGKYGTYILELSAVEGIQVNVAVALRNRHQEAAE